MPLIYVVEDEEDILSLVTLYLESAGFKVKGFQDGSGFFSALSEEQPDLVVLDLMLPDMDGFEICRYLRSEEAYRSLPVIMLTAKGREEDRVKGLEIGADDYVVKPFSPKELVARVRAVLRRVGGGEEPVVIGELSIEPLSHRVKVGGVEVELTPTEFKILKLLADGKGRVFSREEIVDRVWGGREVSERTVDVHIKKIREKLGRAGRLIKSVRGVGYRLEL